MTSEIFEDFPLFPLSIVALPSEVVPLHIFEDRYKTMVDKCVEKQQPFGIVWLAKDGLHEIGCTCEIATEINRTESGERDIIARGVLPFKILNKRGDLDYPAATVEILPEVDEQLDQELASATRQEYASLVEEVAERTVDLSALTAMFSYEMASTIDFADAAKQNLLELRSENARLALLLRLLRGAAKHLELSDLAQARARSNGKIRLR